ncbi:hypothetical protein DV738_g2908, partial [Chaetothyriales sp. CBS 135597]
MTTSRRSKTAIQQDVPPHKEFDIPYFAHQQLDPARFPTDLGLPVGSPPVGNLHPRRVDVVKGWDEAESNTTDGADEISCCDAQSADDGKRKRSPIVRLNETAPKQRKGGDGRPAMSKRVTADLDSDDEMIVRMKNAKYQEKDIARRLADEGRMFYSTKTIGSRWGRLRKAIEARQDELLDANLTDWHEGDDDVLREAIQKADQVVNKAIKEAQDRKWRLVAQNMKLLKVKTYHTLYFSSRFFCRSFHFLSAGFICLKIYCTHFNTMFSRSFKTRGGRVTKPLKSTKTAYPEHVQRKLQASMESPTVGSALTSPIVTFVVGVEQRLFAAHEDVLCRSPFFAATLKGKFLDDSTKKVNLPEEEPEILSCVLEFLYKGDYYPRLLHDKRRNTWDLEDAQDDKNGGRGGSESTIRLPGVGGDVLRDTVVYCAAEKYGLDELKRLALRKQGLQSGIQVDVILRSARYAYDHTPDTESRLRAHYLALIIRSRKTFKRSGTMQMEMENGGKLFFDLFVAMCNHIDDIVEIRTSLVLSDVAQPSLAQKQPFHSRSQQPFSLFPPSVPKIATPNPHKRNPTLQTVKPLGHLSGKGSQSATGASWNGSNGGTTRSSGGGVAKTTTYDRSRSPSPSDIGKAVTTMSPVDGTTPTVPLPPSQSTTSPLSQPRSDSSGSTTLVQTTPPIDPSPVVPIRSMFPTYNPTVPLSQQNYYPQRPFPARLTSISKSNVSRSEYRNTMAAPVDRALGARSAPASVLSFGIDNMSISEPQFSSHRELEKLWEASHGTEPNSSIKSFTLEMSRTDEAVFNFGADPQYPFYTLSTFDTAEISVKKTSPRKRTEVQDVILSSIEPPARRLPPNDGLVTFIFPKMAAMLALNQSAVLAKAHGLASVDKDDVEESAVRRAAQQEACNLRWNESAKRYELEHPAIARRAQDPNFIMSPASPQPNRSQKPVLHITVSSNSRGAPVSAAEPPVILVTNPHKISSPSSSAGPGLVNGIRLSTLPQSDTDSPLASLNLGNLTLSAPGSVYSVGTGPAGVKPYTGSNLYATIAEREEAEEEAAELKKEHEKDITDAKRQKRYTGKRTWYGKKQVVKQTKKRVVMGEFDLEKLGHYQAGDRKGQELPALTRALVGALVGVLRFVVWFLTAIVQFLSLGTELIRLNLEAQEQLYTQHRLSTQRALSRETAALYSKYAQHGSNPHTKRPRYATSPSTTAIIATLGFHPADMKITFPAHLDIPVAVLRSINNILLLQNSIAQAKLRHHVAKYCLPFPYPSSGQQTGRGEAHPHILPLFRLAISEPLQHRLSTMFVGQSIDTHPLGLTRDSVKFLRQAYDARSGAASDLEYMWLARALRVDEGVVREWWRQEDHAHRAKNMMVIWMAAREWERRTWYKERGML